ncbi:hypothetical protein [Acinetobacter variabilis]|uniref:hypothetical protein n=1 Tax=Acinetobacter variabilis TaxID=70346 RepID=UPI00289BF090|nr:hypothetical protein [Acinetobacter variabilis]
MVLSTVKGFKAGIIALAIGWSVQANADDTKGNYIKAAIDQSLDFRHKSKNVQFI